MKTLKLIALTATLMIGASAAYANPADAMGGFDALNTLTDASYATIETVTPTDAQFLKIETDNAALQNRITDNKYITNSLAAQGYAPSDVVGISGNGTNVTLYVL
ncbi:MAG: hypothetical protein JWR51_1811 [Devosia sp.]|uniref:hypothetical protein n=1 Tax=Devosia sp. TaxID=1871048 RepID=UPI00262F04DC|nr:hypothetical protein [Devosia sp.]MDB5528708.1 hypothetical protein [Devosia sp.]